MTHFSKKPLYLAVGFSLAMALPLAATSLPAQATSQQISSVTMPQAGQIFINPEQAWQAALTNNHGLQAREFMRQAERHGVRQAWAALLPQVDASASYGWSRYKRDFGGSVGKVTDTDKPERYDVGLSQIIYSHRAVQSIRRAYAAEDLSAAELEAFRLQIGYLALEAYLDAASLQAEAQLLAEQVANDEKRLEQLESLRKFSMATRADTLEARANLDETLADQLSLESRLLSAMMHLETVTGLDTSKTQLKPLPEDAWRSTPKLLEQDWQATALTFSGSLQSAQKELQLTKQNLAIEKSGHWPEAHLNARYNKNDAFSTNVLEETRVEVQLRLPIYHGGATAAGIRQATSRLDSSYSQVKDTENRLRVEISRLTSELKAGHSSILALRAANESAYAALQAAEQGFLGGVSSLNQLLDSRSRHLRLQRNLLNATHNNLKLQYQLRQTAGTLNAEHINQLNM